MATTTSNSSTTTLLITLEHAADVMMAAPGVVSEAQRKQAEQYFIEMRQANKISLETCRSVLESTSNAFVAFQIVSAVRETTLREWSIFDAQTIQSIWQYLMQYVTSRSDITSFVTNEILLSVSMILKRSIFDHKAGDVQIFYSAIETLITSGVPERQALACQALFTHTQEYANAWRSADVGMTWDFHIRAKREFESNELRDIFSLCVRILSSIVDANSSLATSGHLYSRFIHVAELILTWTFGSKMLPKRLNYSVEFSGPTAAFRPPRSWRTLMLESNVVAFFFQLHNRVRADEKIAHDSLQCLSQLTSTMGEIFIRPHDEIEMLREQMQLSRLADVPDLRDSHVLAVINNLLDVFAEQRTSIEAMSLRVLSHEWSGLCTIITKIFTYHPLPAILRTDPTSLRQFIRFIVLMVQHLTPVAMQHVMNDTDDAQTYVESLSRLLEAWSTLSRAQGRLYEASTCVHEIFDCVVSSMISSTVAGGTRQAIAVESRDTTEEGEDVQDDREMFSDLFVHVGVIGRGAIEHALPVMIRHIDAQLGRLSEYLSLGTQCPPNQLLIWQEDTHWLFMILGHLLTRVDGGWTGCSILGEHLQPFCERNQDELKYTINKCRDYLTLTITAPEQALQIGDGIDPVIRLYGRVLVWSVIEHQLLCDGHSSLLSPQTMRTTMWLLRTLTTALVNFVWELSEEVRVTPDDDDDLPYGESEEIADLADSLHSTQMTDDGPSGAIGAANIVSNEKGLALTHTLRTGTPFMQLLTDFCVRKVFTVLNVWSGEPWLTVDTVALLASFVDSGAGGRELCVGALLAEVAQTNIPALSPATRKQLMRTLVRIGAATDNTTHRQMMFDLILKPLSARFMSMALQQQLRTTETESRTANDITDLLDCFCGVAQATDVMSANFLFGMLGFAQESLTVVADYLQDILRTCPQLLETFAAYQMLIDGVLMFYGEVTRRLAIFLSTELNCSAFYACLLQLLQAYARNQVASKYAQKIDEDKATDLTLMIDMLANILSKDLVLFATVQENIVSDSVSQARSAVDVAMYGLQMLLPLIDMQLLRHPTLCNGFYQLILYMTEIYPERLFDDDAGLAILQAFLRVAELGMSCQYGMDAVRHSLEIIHLIVQYIDQSLHKPCTQVLRPHLVRYLPIVFELCLTTSCDVEVFTEAANALFALYCIHLEAYTEMVDRLILSHTDPKVKQMLRDAFVKLTPPGTPSYLTRNEKRDFRERMEGFLNDISGLLCLQRVPSFANV